MRFLIKFVILLLLLSSCTVSNSNLESESTVLGIRPSVSTRAVPRESAFQVELELKGVVNEAALSNNEIRYNWSVEQLKHDISESYTKTKGDQSSDKYEYKAPNFLLESTKEGLNCYLSIYEAGYYKVTLSSKSGLFTSKSSVILKIGSPTLPELYTKVNIPSLKDGEKRDYRGRFFLKVEGELNTINTELKASELKDDWYNTEIKINPFSSFNILSGTHIGSYLDNEGQVISTLYSLGRESSGKNAANITYSLNRENKSKELTLSPLLFSQDDGISSITIVKDNKTGWNNTIYLTLLNWGFDKRKREKFSFIELTLSDRTPKKLISLKDYFLSKLFIGSYGHRLLPNRYFVYFSPEGVNSKDFDLANRREIPGLPYGYLLGKLGEQGKPFPIGHHFSYYYSDNTPIYYLDKSNHFRRLKL